MASRFIGARATYYVFQRHFGSARLLDLYGLTDDSLVRCLPEKNLKRSIWGVGPSELWLLANLKALDRCGIQRPDVIYNVNMRAKKRESLRKAGYTVVFENVGSMRSPHSLFPGGGGSSAYVAVRDDLLDRVHLPVSKIVFPLESEGSVQVIARD